MTSNDELPRAHSESPRPRPPAPPSTATAVAAAPAQTPVKKSAGLTTALSVLAVLLVLAIVADVVLFLRPDAKTSSASAASTTPSSTTPASTAPTSATPPEGQLVTHKTGAFSVVVATNGWQLDSTATSSVAAGAPAIRVAPDISAYNSTKGAVGFAVVDLTGVQFTPEQYVASVTSSNYSGCVYSQPANFAYKGFTGTFTQRKKCANANPSGILFDYDSIYLGVTRSDGTKVGMVIHDRPGETSTRARALTVLETIQHK